MAFLQLSHRPLHCDPMRRKRPSSSGAAPTGRANARPMTGSGLSPESIPPSIRKAPWILRCAIAHRSSLVALASRNDEGAAIALHLTGFSQSHLICRSCQCAAGIFACGVGQITSTFPRIPARYEGRFAIVTKRWAGDAVDAFRATRRARVRRTAKSCGPDIPTLISSL